MVAETRGLLEGTDLNVKSEAEKSGYWFWMVKVSFLTPAIYNLDDDLRTHVHAFSNFCMPEWKYSVA